MSKTLSFINTNNSEANADLNNDNNNSEANADLTNYNSNSNANADLPNLYNSYATWCHIGGLLRSDASVGFSMLIPLTHGAHTKEGSVDTPRGEPTPINMELLSNTLPQLNNTYPNNQEPLLNTLPQTNLNTLPQSVFNAESVPVFYMFVQSDGH